MTKSLVTIILFAISLLSFADTRSEIKVSRSDSKKIDNLVLALVSKRPAPFPTGYYDNHMSPFKMMSFIKNGRYSTIQVETAIKDIKTIGPSAYIHLTKHIYDDRYCYSYIGPWGSPTMSGWTNESVGGAIDTIFSNNISPWIGGYKGRRKQSPPSFSEFIKSKGGIDKWALSVVKTTRKKIDLDYIDWCISIEKTRGFDSKEEEDSILGNYLEYKIKLQQKSKK